MASEILIIGIVGGLFAVGVFVFFNYYYQPYDVLNFPADSELLYELNIEPSIFKIYVNQEYSNLIGNQTISGSYLIKPHPNFEDLYPEISARNDNQNTIVVYPIFTAAAYKDPGFYSYFQGECNEECLTVELRDRDDYLPKWSSSGAGLQVLNILGYQFISDLEIEKNPEILSNYDKVILLHNEYVTRNEFNAITSHPKVLYLYPNALHAEVKYNEEDNTISLIRGHAYPETDITNGFDWELDNTPMEENIDCLEWEIYEIENGTMLNCYPEILILKDLELLKLVKSI